MNSRDIFEILATPEQRRLRRINEQNERANPLNIPATENTPNLYQKNYDKVFGKDNSNG